MWWDERPSRNELLRWEWLDQTCAECGERRADCACPPGCSCDPEEE